MKNISVSRMTLLFKLETPSAPIGHYLRFADGISLWKILWIF